MQCSISTRNDTLVLSRLACPVLATLVDFGFHGSSPEPRLLDLKPAYSGRSCIPCESPLINLSEWRCSLGLMALGLRMMLFFRSCFDWIGSEILLSGIRCISRFGLMLAKCSIRVQHMVVRTFSHAALRQKSAGNGLCRTTYK